MLVEGADRESRIYDGRDHSSIDLGSVVTAVWSPDEERLLLVASDGRSVGSPSLLAGRAVTKIRDIGKIGAIARMVFPDKPDRAFLLAGMEGQLSVFLVALPWRHILRHESWWGRRSGRLIALAGARLGRCTQPRSPHLSYRKSG